MIFPLLAFFHHHWLFRIRGTYVADYFSSFIQCRAWAVCRDEQLTRPKSKTNLFDSDWTSNIEFAVWERERGFGRSLSARKSVCDNLKVHFMRLPYILTMQNPNCHVSDLDIPTIQICHMSFNTWNPLNITPFCLPVTFSRNKGVLTPDLSAALMAGISLFLIHCT